MGQVAPAALLAALTAKRARVSMELIVGAEPGAVTVQDSSFAGLGGWTVGANHAIAGGVLGCTGAGITYQDISSELEAGQPITIGFKQTTATGTTVRLRFYDVLGNECATFAFDPSGLVATTSETALRSYAIDPLGGGWFSYEVVMVLGAICQTVRAELETGATATEWDDVSLTALSVTLTSRVKAPFSGSRRTKETVSPLELRLNNNDSLLSPYNQDSEYYLLLLQNRRIRLNVGYNGGHVRVFTGYISQVNPNSPPGEIRLRCSSMMKRGRRRKIIDPSTGLRYGKIAGPIALEEVVKTLAKWAGWPESRIHCDTTGVILEDGWPWSNKDFDVAWEELAGQVGYVVMDDEIGDFHFRFPRGANTVTEVKTLTGTTPASLANAPIAGGATVTDGGSTTYSEGTDYLLDLANATIQRAPGGTIPDGGSVTITYTPIEWVFEPGQDLSAVEQILDDEDLEYSQHFVSRNGLTSDYDYPNRVTLGILKGRESWNLVDGDAEAADMTQIADSYGRAMAATSNRVAWSSVGIPQRQIRDVVQPYDPILKIKDAYMLTGYGYNWNGTRLRYTWEATHFDAAAVPT